MIEQLTHIVGPPFCAAAYLIMQVQIKVLGNLLMYFFFAISEAMEQAMGYYKDLVAMRFSRSL